MSQMFSLDGRIALITGSSRGLGMAMAKALAEHGALVLINGRDKAAVEAGARGAEKVGEVIAIHVIPRPHANVDSTLPLGRQPGEQAKAA